MKHVKLSDKATKMLEDKKLTAKVVDAIIENKKSLHFGKKISVESLQIVSATN